MKTTISFKNRELAGIANTLGQFKLKGKSSLGRSTLIRKLANKQEEYIADRVLIQQKYFEADKDGNLKTLDDGSEKLIPKPELADEKDPSKVLYRTQPYLLAPAAPYETVGDVANVVFPCAALNEGNKVAVYYGAADTVVAMAFGYVDEILAFTKKNSV